MWDRCPKCDRILVNESNLWTLRAIIGGATVGGAILGAVALPLVGFGAGGVAAGSAAAAWQSSIGAVTAGSLFALLQSLGATGIGIVLFGSVGAGMGLLSGSAARIGWCNGDCDKDAQKNTTQDVNNTQVDKSDEVKNGSKDDAIKDETKNNAIKKDTNDNTQNNNQTNVEDVKIEKADEAANKIEKA